MHLNLQRLVKMKICCRLTNNLSGDTHTFASYTSDLYLPCSQKKHFACWKSAGNTQLAQKLPLWWHYHGTGAAGGSGWCS